MTRNSNFETGLLIVNEVQLLYVLSTSLLDCTFTKETKCDTDVSSKTFVSSLYMVSLVAIAISEQSSSSKLQRP